MDWLSASVFTLLALAGLVVLFSGGLLLYILYNYSGVIARIFQEQPLFVIPEGQPLPGCEEVRFRTEDGYNLAGSYLHTSAAQRRGVILFGPEYGSNRWTAGSYCEQLLAGGYDVFSFEFRNQGQSDVQPDYEPLQWVTDYEIRDLRAAVAYLKQRPDAPAEGVGLFGISRGGCAGIVVAAKEPWIRCVVTDGAFATRSTMVPYMKKWVAIYSRLKMQYWLPKWFYALIAYLMVRRIEKARNCRYPSLKTVIGKIAPRPLLMIHGGADTYIKPAIARELFKAAREPKEFWLVDKAKHNQALHVAGQQYHQRIIEFFSRHLPRNGMTPTSTKESVPEPLAVV